MRHELKILKRGMSTMIKLQRGVIKKRYELEKINKDFCNNEMQELIWFRDLASQFIQNNVGEEPSQLVSGMDEIKQNDNDLDNQHLDLKAEVHAQDSLIQRL